MLSPSPRRQHLSCLLQACALAVPALKVFPKGTSVPAASRLAALGYREKEGLGAEDAADAPRQPQLESTDDFLARVQVISCLSHDE